MMIRGFFFENIPFCNEPPFGWSEFCVFLCSQIRCNISATLIHRCSRIDPIIIHIRLQTPTEFPNNLLVKCWSDDA